MGFDKLMDILGKAGGRFPALAKRLKEAEALGRWEAAVGPIIAKHSRAIRVQDATLWVEVDHPIWKSELHHRKQQILAILNGKAPAPPPPLTKSGKPRAKAPSDNTPLIDILFLDPRGSLSAERKGPFSTQQKPRK